MRVVRWAVLAVVLGLAGAGLRPVAAQTPLPNNPHGALRPGTDCADCHTASDWKTVKAKLAFDHARDTKFPLTGRHATVACARCHLGLRFDEPTGSETQCTSCHADVHRGNLVGECVRCHTTTSFRDVPAVAVHQRTGFPLIGAHLQAPCESCHRTERNGAYTAVPSECGACHRAAMARAAVTVDHTGFPADCGQCHTSLAWSGGVAFDHASVSRGFQLQGAHADLRCANCHVQPGNALRFTPRPSGSGDCVACHQPDYQRAHAGSGFPTTCTTCHTLTSWGAGTVDHDGQFFRINSGAHRGRWTSCAVCHTAPGDFRSFSCLGCHEHSQSLMDNAHRGRSGYVYDSQACYRCHGRA